MIREIQIGDVSAKFKATALLPILYIQEIGRDYFKDINQVDENFGVAFDLAWVMHRAAEPDAQETKEQWLDRFDYASFNQAIIDELIPMLTEVQKAASTAKKKSAS